MRIAIVNDTMMAVEGLRRILFAETDHQLAWVAVNGEEALKRCAQDLPDLILMDLIMPVMNGVEATCKIMSATPCPILIVTSTVEGHSALVFEAMGGGALDVVKTPVLGLLGDIPEDLAILEKIRTIERLTRPVTVTRAKTAISPASFSAAPHSISHRNQSLIAIGSSTGGPPALGQILADLPEDFPAGVVIIQHIDAHFSGELATWLNTQCKMQVKIAEEGECIAPGVVYLAATNDHLVISSRGRLTYTEHPKEMVYRPSVDAFFESVAAHWGGNVTAVLLTGMGRDGATGLLALRQKGVHTIAQDKATCAVYGMPKAAASLNAAVEVLPLDKIGTELFKRHNTVAQTGGWKGRV